jgi:uncharacterized membrane protein YphA (DoxX/SURF4 family)
VTPPSSKRSPALAALRRYYPGFLGATFLVLLRIAIGWHLTAEGLYKFMSRPEGRGELAVTAPEPADPARKDGPARSAVETTRAIEARGKLATRGWAFGRYFHPTEGPTFTSEGYQRQASGPFAERFRNMIGDPEGRDALDLDKLKARWKEEEGRISGHFDFTAEQKAEADKAESEAEAKADDYFRDPEFREKRKKYLDNLDELARLDAKPKKMTYEVERYYEARKSLEADRKDLVAPINGWTKTLGDAWLNLATEDQVATAGPYEPPMSEVEKADRITMYGLTICGIALMVGLLTPVAGLGSACFLFLFYISMPPWPGLPVPPNAEGHYYFVNKNLIEMIACLAIASTPSGMWVGLDALLFGWIYRIRARRALRREQAEFERAVREAAGGRIPVEEKRR